MADAETSAATAPASAATAAAAAPGGARSAAWSRARAWHAARLAEDASPSVAWTLVALAGLAAWIGCAVGLLLRGVGDDDRLRPRPALSWALGVAAGLALFFVGLWRA
jgi:hypothetical protein